METEAVDPLASSHSTKESSSDSSRTLLAFTRGREKVAGSLSFPSPTHEIDLKQTSTSLPAQVSPSDNIHDSLRDSDSAFDLSFTDDDSLGDSDSDCDLCSEQVSEGGKALDDVPHPTLEVEQALESPNLERAGSIEQITTDEIRLRALLDCLNETDQDPQDELNAVRKQFSCSEEAKRKLRGYLVQSEVVMENQQKDIHRLEKKLDDMNQEGEGVLHQRNQLAIENKTLASGIVELERQCDNLRVHALILWHTIIDLTKIRAAKCTEKAIGYVQAMKDRFPQMVKEMEEAISSPVEQHVSPTQQQLVESSARQNVSPAYTARAADLMALLQGTLPMQQQDSDEDAILARVAEINRLFRGLTQEVTSQKAIIKIEMATNRAKDEKLAQQKSTIFVLRSIVLDQLDQLKKAAETIKELSKSANAVTPSRQQITAGQHIMSLLERTMTLDNQSSEQAKIQQPSTAERPQSTNAGKNTTAPAPAPAPELPTAYSAANQLVEAHQQSGPNFLPVSTPEARAVIIADLKASCVHLRKEVFNGAVWFAFNCEAGCPSDDEDVTRSALLGEYCNALQDRSGDVPPNNIDQGREIEHALVLAAIAAQLFYSLLATFYDVALFVKSSDGKMHLLDNAASHFLQNIAHTAQIAVEDFGRHLWEEYSSVLDEPLWVSDPGQVRQENRRRYGHFCDLVAILLRILLQTMRVGAPLGLIFPPPKGMPTRPNGAFHPISALRQATCGKIQSNYVFPALKLRANEASPPCETVLEECRLETTADADPSPRFVRLA